MSSTSAMPRKPFTTPAVAWHQHTSCEICERRFFLSGRHHCRHCGRTVCSAHFHRPLCSWCNVEANRAAQPLPPPGAPEFTEERPEASAFKQDDSDVPRGTEIVTLALDVYATAFTLCNNATPGMYSCSVFQNRAMWMCWFYVIFIAASQSFVLLSMLWINPAVVDMSTTFVDCTSRLPAAVFERLTDDECQRLPVAFELAATAAVPAVPAVVMRRFEEPTYYYQAIFQGDGEHTFLQLVCCLWVTVQVTSFSFLQLPSASYSFLQLP